MTERLLRGIHSIAEAVQTQPLGDRIVAGNNVNRHVPGRIRTGYSAGRLMIAQQDQDRLAGLRQRLVTGQPLERVLNRVDVALEQTCQSIASAIALAVAASEYGLSDVTRDQSG